MTERECALLMMYCGALKDISEQTRDRKTRRQVEEVQEKIQNLITNSIIKTESYEIKN